MATKPECHDVATEDHVRTQYVHFANELARSGYYKLGRSKSELVARPVMDILKIYYGGDALDQIIKLSAKWPVDVDVKHPDTTVNSFKFNEKCTFVELNTTEVWSVTKAKGGPIPELCLELGESHDVTLEQQSNRFTWKVTKITNFPACLQIPR